jgi:hypothetical protein
MPKDDADRPNRNTTRPKNSWTEREIKQDQKRISAPPKQSHHKISQPGLRSHRRVSRNETHGAKRRDR